MPIDKDTQRPWLNGNGQVPASITTFMAVPNKRVEIFVPTTDNDSSRVDDPVLQELLELAVETFGGCTLHPNLVGGWSAADGTKVYDAIIKVEVEVDATPQSLQAVRFFGETVRQRLQQDTVFITVEDVGS